MILLASTNYILILYLFFPNHMKENDMKKEKKENIWLGGPHADTTEICNIRLPRDRLTKKNYILQDSNLKLKIFGTILSLIFSKFILISRSAL